MHELNRRAGVRQKQAAWRLERIPSSVVVHKRLDSTDSRWLEQTARFQNNPLEHNLGFFDFGKYHKAANDAKYAFEKVEELMGYDIDFDDDDEDSEDENDDGKEQGGEGKASKQSDNEAQPSSSQPSGLEVEVGRKIDSARPLSSAELIRQLAKKVKASKDKLFFIKRLRPRHKLAMWHLVQVDEEETDWRAARTEGIYHLLFYVRAYCWE